MTLSTAIPTAMAPPDSARFVRASDWLRRRADSRGGLIGMFVWAFAEALVWPIIPDASLALLVASRPRRWAALAASAVAGSVAGGVAGVVAAARGLTWPLWLTTTRMADAVAVWLRDGAAGLAHQPLSGVPYKVFVAHAGEAGITPAQFAVATLQYRAPRLVAVAVITAVVAAVAWKLIAPRWQATVHVLTSAIATVALFAGLAAVVARWS